MRGPSHPLGMTVKCALLCAAAYFLAPAAARAAEKIPPKPAGYFDDYAGVVSKDAAFQLNEQLAQFERETSNQIVVAVFRKMETDSDVFDYTHRVARSWGVGQKDKRNGAVLFVFVDDRKMFIQVGYGLEGALPDITARDITEHVMKPHFKAGDYEAGLRAGVTAMLQAVRGEYVGTGKTVAEADDDGPESNLPVLVLIGFVVLMIMIARASRKRGGYRYSSRGGPFFGGFGGGSSWGGGSSGGGGFSGFSGGGGSFGGGGAGSSW